MMPGTVLFKVLGGYLFLVKIGLHSRLKEA